MTIQKRFIQSKPADSTQPGKWQENQGHFGLYSQSLFKTKYPAYSNVKKIDTS
jgi:hypothetical protein